MTGTTRAISSSAPTTAWPGRVDSPPTSRMSAPSATIARAPARRPPRPGRRSEQAVAGERVRRDVDDAHDERPLAPVERRRADRERSIRQPPPPSGRSNDGAERPTRPADRPRPGGRGRSSAHGAPDRRAGVVDERAHARRGRASRRRRPGRPPTRSRSSAAPRVGRRTSSRLGAAPRTSAPPARLAASARGTIAASR